MDLCVVCILVTCTSTGWLITWLHTPWRVREGMCGRVRTMMVMPTGTLAISQSCIKFHLNIDHYSRQSLAILWTILSFICYCLFLRIVCLIRSVHISNFEASVMNADDYWTGIQTFKSSLKNWKELVCPSWTLERWRRTLLSWLMAQSM